MRLLLVALGATLAAILVPATAAVAAVPHVFTDPSSNRSPSTSFNATCRTMSATQSANQACDQVALPDFNAARAAEGVKALVLPEDFDTLSVPMQVLAITDLERVDRGLPPVPGLSSRLNSLAQQGANANQDPQFPNPFDGTSARSSWADGDSALLAAFLWMYDDGAGGPNGECATGQEEGCWGHRHTILDTYDSPIAMGAAFAANTAGSITEEIVGGDTTDTIDQTPTWADISGTLTYGVSPTSVTKTADVGAMKHATITATSSGGSGHLEVGFQSGAPTWSVSPNECDLASNGSCQFVVTFAPTTPGNYPGVLTVSDGTNVKTVALSGTGITPQVDLQASTTSVLRGGALKLVGFVTADPTNAALPNRNVALQAKVRGGTWQTLSTATTGGAGKVTYRLHPSRTARYRLEVLGTGGSVAAKSSVVKVVVG